MKNIWMVCIGIVFVMLHSCATTPRLQPQQLTDLLESETFTFMAKSANPSNYDVINIMNALPNSSSSRILNLDYGYGFVLKKEELVVTLPYFGRLFNATLNQDQNSFRFTSKNYEIQKSKTKKGNDLWIIHPKDVSHVRSIYLEIFQNGNAYVSIDANDRQPISYDGYLMKNEISKNENF